MTTLLVLGAGLMQEPVLRAARAAGCVVHAADGNPQARNRQLVDVFHHVDLRDRDGLVTLAQSIKQLDGCLTVGTDFSDAVAAVCQAVGLPGHRVDAALRARDKGAMRRALTAAGRPQPQAWPIASPDDAALREVERALDAGHTLVIKPADSMGARAVQRCTHRSQLAEALAGALEASLGRGAVVETFIEGQEFSLDAFVLDGTVYHRGLGTRRIYFPPAFVELGHDIPSRVPTAERLILERELERAALTIELTHGAAKGDLFLDPSGAGATVGEIAARLSGGYMSGWTYRKARGVDLSRHAIAVAQGSVDPPPQPAWRLYAAERAIVSAPGVVRHIAADLERLSSRVTDRFWSVQPGDRLASPRNNLQKAGNVIAVAPSADEAARAADDALLRMYPVLEPGNPASTDYLLKHGWHGTYALYAVDAAFARYLAQEQPLLPTRKGDQLLIRDHCAELSLRRPGVPAAATLTAALASGYARLVADDEVAHDDRLFWRAVTAGGIQGARYAYDSLVGAAA